MADREFRDRPSLQFKLPELKAPEFSGLEPEKFQSFFKTFDLSVHRNKDLGDDAKFLYLQSSLRAPALDLLEGLDTDAKGYQEARTRLINRYQNGKRIRHEAIMALANLSLDDTQKATAARLAAEREFYNAIQLQLQRLKNYSVKDEELSLFMLPLLLSRLPFNIRKEWLIRVDKLKEEDYAKKTHHHLLDLFAADLKARETIQEQDRLQSAAKQRDKKIQQAREKKEKEKAEKSQKDKKDKDKVNATFATTGGAQTPQGGHAQTPAQASATGTTQKAQSGNGGAPQNGNNGNRSSQKEPVWCIFCGAQGHYAYKCTQQVSPRQKLDALRRNSNYCLNCYFSRHKADECKRNTCNHCGHRHNPELHDVIVSERRPRQ